MASGQMLIINAVLVNNESAFRATCVRLKWSHHLNFSQYCVYLLKGFCSNAAEYFAQHMQNRRNAEQMFSFYTRFLFYFHAMLTQFLAPFLLLFSFTVHRGNRYTQPFFMSHPVTDTTSSIVLTSIYRGHFLRILLAFILLFVMLMCCYRWITVDELIATCRGLSEEWPKMYKCHLFRQLTGWAVD